MIIYDTTLRDGTQNPDINLSVHDKLEIAKALDSFGVDYIELGWPSSNPKDMECFRKAADIRFKHSKVTAFCSTKRKGIRAEDDANLNAVIASKAKATSIFGKTWLEHVEKQLRMTPEDNLDVIKDSISFLKKNDIEVFYDAEHYFDGYKADKDYAIRCLKTARAAGASCIVLCDTNGGTLPHEIGRIVKETMDELNCPLGIHCHNDSGLAVANSIEAIRSGAVHVQGTINGFGERSGNCDLTVLLPDLILKMGIKHENVNLKGISILSNLVYNLANEKPNSNQPYVGRNAFSHKGGIHVDAIMKGASYEHIDPSLVGNKRDIILSDLSGKANIVEVAKKFNVHVSKDAPEVKDMLSEVELMEKRGYDIGSLDAEKFLLVKKHLQKVKDPFTISAWKITSEDRDGEFSECILTGVINGERFEVNAPVHGGPVDAVYHALNKMIVRRYPKIQDISLTNFKVMIAEESGAESSVRVFIEFKDHKVEWGCVGVSTNILEASLEAIKKGFLYYLLKD